VPEMDVRTPANKGLKASSSRKKLKLREILGQAAPESISQALVQ